jgi:membrane protease subunit (stomatin/prohibitin family)
MPGLLRGVARTAVIAGTATHVSNNVSRRQAQRWNDQAQQQAPAAPAAAPQEDVNDQMAQLTQLSQLKDQGILTQEEFDAKKKQILGL